MINFLHIIDHVKYTRVHLTFKDTDKITNYYLLPKYNLDKSIDFIETGTQLIKSKNIFVSKLTKLDSMKEGESYKKFIDTVKPIAILTANPGIEQFDQKFFDYLKTIAPLIYIPHGLTHEIAVPHFIKKQFILNRWKNLDYVLTNKNDYQIFSISKELVNKNRIHLINGMPSFEHIINTSDSAYNEDKIKFYKNIDRNNGNLSKGTKNPLPLDKKSILFVVCESPGPTLKKKYVASDILKELLEFAINNNVQIFCKMKHNGINVSHISENDELKKIVEHKNITVIPFHDNSMFFIHQFFWADVIVIQAQSTTIFEALLHKNNVLMCNCDNSFGLNKFDAMPRIYNKNEIQKWLNILFFDQTFPSDKFLQQKKIFIEDNIGEINKVKNVSKQIIDIIKDNLL